MGSGTPAVTTQTYQASGIVRAGGEGQLDAHGLKTAFDGTAGRLDALPSARAGSTGASSGAPL